MRFNAILDQFLNARLPVSRVVLTIAAEMSLDYSLKDCRHFIALAIEHAENVVDGRRLTACKLPFGGHHSVSFLHGPYCLPTLQIRCNDASHASIVARQLQVACPHFAAII